jgi:hypothetical protein
VYDTLLAPLSVTDPKYPFMRLTVAKLKILLPAIYHLLDITECRVWYPESFSDIQADTNYILEKMVDVGVISFKAGEKWSQYNIDWIDEKLNHVFMGLSVIHREHNLARLSRSDGYIPEFDACYTAGTRTSHV